MSGLKAGDTVVVGRFLLKAGEKSAEEHEEH